MPREALIEHGIGCRAIRGEAGCRSFVLADACRAFFVPLKRHHRYDTIPPLPFTGFFNTLLTGESEFERLLRFGTRQQMAGYTFFYRRREAGPPRLGILVSKRHSASAVVRNRIKRRVREAFRLEQQGLGSLDLLIRPPYRAEASVYTIARLRELLIRLNS